MYDVPKRNAKVSVTLEEAQIHKLGDAAIKVRVQSGTAVSNSYLINRIVAEVDMAKLVAKIVAEVNRG